MINNDTLEEIKHYPVNDKIEIIESLLDSLKSDIPKQGINTFKPFRIRKISLGQEVHIDRDILYSERG